MNKLRGRGRRDLRSRSYARIVNGASEREAGCIGAGNADYSPNQNDIVVSKWL